MNIAYVASSRIPSRGADSVHVMKMCGALSDTLASANMLAPRNSVTLIVPDYEQTEQNADNIFEYYGVSETFTVKKVAIRFPDMKSKHIRRAFKLARIAAKGNYDIIYSRNIHACFYIAKVFRKDIYFEYHSSFRSGSMYERMFRALIRSKHLKHIIVITQALKQHFLAHYKLEDAQISVAPDCADLPPETLTPVELNDKSKNMFNVGYVGHLYKGRGLELLGDMATSCPFAFFHIVGGNDADVDYWKDKYRHIDNIHFYGFVPPSQTACYGKSMDVLIAPYQHIVYVEGSKSAEESTANWMSPMKVFEYMALGKPIICSDLPVLREVLADGENALLCTPDDITAWCDAIERLYKNKKLSTTLSENAFASFSRHYTWDARARNILQHICL